MLDQDASYDERCVVILIVFLASQLICRKKLVNVEAQFKSIVCVGFGLFLVSAKTSMSCRMILKANLSDRVINTQI